MWKHMYGNRSYMYVNMYMRVSCLCVCVARLSEAYKDYSLASILCKHRHCSRIHIHTHAHPFFSPFFFFSIHRLRQLRRVCVSFPFFGLLHCFSLCLHIFLPFFHPFCVPPPTSSISVCVTHPPLPSTFYLLHISLSTVSINVILFHCPPPPLPPTSSSYPILPFCVSSFSVYVISFVCKMTIMTMMDSLRIHVFFFACFSLSL